MPNKATLWDEPPGGVSLIGLPIEGFLDQLVDGSWAFSLLLAGRDGSLVSDGVPTSLHLEKLVRSDAILDVVNNQDVTIFYAPYGQLALYNPGFTAVIARNSVAYQNDLASDDLGGYSKGDPLVLSRASVAYQTDAGTF